jgi:hypothetical protein
MADPAGGCRTADTCGVLSCGGATVCVVVCTVGGVGVPAQAPSNMVAAVADAANSQLRLDVMFVLPPVPDNATPAHRSRAVPPYTISATSLARRRADQRWAARIVTEFA